MQAQIQALLATQGGARTEGAVTGSNAGPSMEVAKLAIFNGEVGKVGGFITACRLYLRMKMRGTSVEEQVQWVLLYVQGGSAEEATITSAGDNRACSNGRDREDEYGSSEGYRPRGRDSSKTESLCYGGGSGTELLRLWGFWAYGPTLQKSRTERKGGGE